MKGQRLSATEILRILRGSNFLTVIGSTKMTNQESIRHFEFVDKDKIYNVSIDPSYYGQGVHLLIQE